ncbi:permease-like cell division protein FtsX [Nonomuraea sp. NPDC050790]|uniref:permease-like cell division protein FtsX n=1 Tax=Nonomuraea sp. NPDC050790 TaxID=3364371 RepID=UPI0037937AFD
MNSPVEERLRQALSEAGAVIDPETLRPLRTVPTARRHRVDLRWIGVSWASMRLLIGRVGRRWVAVSSVVAVAGLVAGVVIVAPGGHQSTAAAVLPPNRDRADLSVFLCHAQSTSPTCRGEAITDEQRAAVQQALGEAPMVQTITFESQREAYENFKSDPDLPEHVKKVVQVRDMPESFRVKMRAGADYRSLIAKVKVMPGVAQVVDARLVPQPAGGA